MHLHALIRRETYECKYTINRRHIKNKLLKSPLT